MEVMMTTWNLLTLDQAPEASREVLGQVQQKFGFLPNLMGVLAHAPSTLSAYVVLSDLFSRTSLSQVEQQVVLLTVSIQNDCRYCVAAHSVGARMVGVPPDVLADLRSGAPLRDAKLEALRQFTQKMVQSRGWLGEADLQAFAAAGYSRQNVLEVILGVALKTISNYTNHIAGTPLDEAFQAEEWRGCRYPGAGGVRT
jgi:uncharacterized peroxidase-related enzyme